MPISGLPEIGRPRLLDGTAGAALLHRGHRRARRHHRHDGIGAVVHEFRIALELLEAARGSIRRPPSSRRNARQAPRRRSSPRPRTYGRPRRSPAHRESSRRSSSPRPCAPMQCSLPSRSPRSTPSSALPSPKRSRFGFAQAGHSRASRPCQMRRMTISFRSGKGAYRIT